MPRDIIKLTKNNKDFYLEWSTVINAPVTYGVPLDEFKEYYRSRYGEEGMCGLDERLARVEAKGTSSQLDDSLEELISSNRAGENGTHLPLERLIEEYIL